MTGPHGGSVVELGTETYHAELVHDEASGSVIVYLLDSTIKNPVASDAEEVVINMKHGDAPEQFQLAAQPQVGDPPGKTSRYASTSADLGEELHEEHDSVMLVLTIDGKQYRGAIAHDHDHDGGHDHGHNHADGAGH